MSHPHDRLNENDRVTEQPDAPDADAPDANELDDSQLDDVAGGQGKWQWGEENDAFWNGGGSSV